jgi:hypothetical protein
MFRRTRHFETQFYSLANPLRDLVQRSRLRVASRELWDRSDVVAFFIPFNDNIELARQWRVLDFYSSPLGANSGAKARRDLPDGRLLTTTMIDGGKVRQGCGIV